MADVSRLTPRPSPAHQPRTASMAPPRALADGRDGTERPDNEAHLVDRADRAADQLPPDTRSMTGLARGAPPAGAPPRRPPPASALARTRTRAVQQACPCLDIGRPAAQSRDVRCWCPLRQSSYPLGHSLPRAAARAPTPSGDAYWLRLVRGRPHHTVRGSVAELRLHSLSVFDSRQWQCAISRSHISRNSVVGTVLRKWPL